MSKSWKIAAIAVFAAAVLCIGMIIAFRAVTEREWGIQRMAVQTAYEKTILAKANKVERFVGDKTYTVIYGEDKIGQPIYVWVAEDEIRTEMGSAGLSAGQAEALVKTKHPQADVLRVMLGVQDGQPVWEVFYKLKPENASRDQYFYDFYTFKDGLHRDTWRLSIQ
ncbi:MULTISPECIES: DUF5590 domain-containing protein [unclassified Paenibacillus]|uniref:cell wall elongation regulator TseB-like domain-containing protein n=1 Tax=unclassified Paenibacillus TaxID=185978 RepID=UPI0006D1E6E0|nr:MULTISPECIES: DUF5590 domain-containing protein [unclassified Paenibacillus]